MRSQTTGSPVFGDVGKVDERREAGKRAYRKFLRPPKSPNPNAIWYENRMRDFPFFFADTRTERKPRSAVDIDNAQIMGEEQFETLLSWLSDHRQDRTPVFVVSPSILLPRHRLATCSKASALCSDAWDGFPYSFRRLLAHIAREQIHNVVFLSGDEHQSCIASVTLTARDPEASSAGKPVTIHSIHSSALYAPFVFANGAPADLAGDEHFQFEDPDSSRGKWTIECTVNTDFACRVGAGFAVIACELAASERWRLACRFHIDGCPPMPLREVRVTPRRNKDGDSTRGLSDVHLAATTG